jgi:hypothetical protein
MSEFLRRFKMMSEDSPTAFLARYPLVRFSVYSQIQAQTLIDLSVEITGLMESSIKDGQFVDGSNIQLIYGRFWLWVLGAYEVSRTMSEYKSCFSGALNRRVSAFKAQISILRMPFAKLQFKGSDMPINGEASISGIDIETKDFVFHVGDKRFPMRWLMNEFVSLVASIRPEDVVRDLRAANVRN